MRGVRVDAVSLDVDAVLAATRLVRLGLGRRSQVRWLDGEGIALRRGSGASSVNVGSASKTTAATTRSPRSMRWRCAPGLVPRIPPVDGLDEVRAWTSREATERCKVPDRLVIIGGGVVGCEMATVFQGLGQPGDDAGARRRRCCRAASPSPVSWSPRALRESGVVVHPRASAQRDALIRARRAHRSRDGRTIDADEVLVATGRRPNTDDLGLESIGIEPGQPLRGR